jgi:lipid-A-disaccharide synthase
MSERNDAVLVIAGEASGDLHGGKLVRRLRELAPGTSLFGMGGDAMRDAGMELTFHCDDFSVVGLVEVLRLLPRSRRALREIARLVRERQTRLAILIDYPGFNLLLARRLRAMGVKVLYYVSPQVWAWGEGRVKKIARRVDRMAVILPFEKAFYAERGIEVEYVGHPLLEEPDLAAPPPPKTSLGDPPLLGLLPGSRRHEVERHLPAMIGAVDLLRAEFPDLRVRLARADGIDAGTLERAGDPAGNGVEVVGTDEAYRLMRDATALLVCSGTATLEAACVGTPMVVLYRMAFPSYFVGRMLVRIPHIALVNVVAGERVVPELVQNRVTPAHLASEVRPFLTDRALLEHTSRRLLAVREGLGSAGASDRVARMAVDMLGGA